MCKTMAVFGFTRISLRVDTRPTHLTSTPVYIRSIGKSSSTGIRRGITRRRTTCWPVKPKLPKRNRRKLNRMWSMRFFPIGTRTWPSTSSMTTLHGWGVKCRRHWTSSSSLSQRLTNTTQSCTSTNIGISWEIICPSMRPSSKWQSFLEMY